MNKPCNKCNYSAESYFGKSRIPGYSSCADCDEYRHYKNKLEAKRKYRIGSQIKSFQEFNEYMEENDIVYCHNKPYHAGWVLSWQYRMVKILADKGSFYRAVKNAAM